MIPGFIISMLTFPGVVMHELAHQSFCRLFRLPVFEVCYLRFGNPSGNVVHEIPKEAYKDVLIGVGPFFVNTIVGALIAAPSSIAVMDFNSGSILDFFLMWLGVSIAMHSFPSTGDAKGIWRAIYSEGTSIWLKIIGTPIVGLIYLGALGSVVWLDLIYGVAVSVALPHFIGKLLA